MIGFQAAFLQQLLNVPQRQRISKIPADRAENERRFCLTPLEDRRSRSHFTILSRCQRRAYESCNTTLRHPTPWSGVLVNEPRERRSAPPSRKVKNFMRRGHST